MTAPLPNPHETVGPGARCACGDDHTTGPDPFEAARAANTICSGHSCAICSGPEWWSAHECTARATEPTDDDSLVWVASRQ